jgi:hypothetical protein
MMILIKVYNNMNNLKIDNVNSPTKFTTNEFTIFYNIIY